VDETSNLFIESGTFFDSIVRNVKTGNVMMAFVARKWRNKRIVEMKMA